METNPTHTVHRPSIVTTIALSVGDMVISSVDYTLSGIRINETAVFFDTTDHSEVVGTYDDHIRVVTEKLDALKVVNHLMV